MPMISPQVALERCGWPKGPRCRNRDIELRYDGTPLCLEHWGELNSEDMDMHDFRRLCKIARRRRRAQASRGNEGELVDAGCEHLRAVDELETSEDRP